MNRIEYFFKFVGYEALGFYLRRYAFARRIELGEWCIGFNIFDGQKDLTICNRDKVQICG